MINDILEAVAVALQSEFGNGYEIYSDPIPQGTTEPCFFVLLLNSTIRRVMGNRYYMTNQICIQYLPSDTLNPKTEFTGVIERLMTTVDDIIIDTKPIHGSNIHTESTEDVLSFFVNYDLFVNRENIPAEKMKNIEIYETVKGE